METDSPVVYHGTSESRFPQKEVPKNYLDLTKEEKELFRECNKESLYYRCLPFAFAGMAATHLAVKKGFLSAHPMWGSGLKMTGAAFLGWILGKFSYRKTCEDKFLTLQNSSIADVIRKSRGISSESFQSEYMGTKSDETLGFKRDPKIPTSYSNDYYSSSGSLNLDMDKNVQYSGLDDRERPSTDRDVTFSQEAGVSIPKYTTYDELRTRNREEYEKSQMGYAPKPREYSQGAPRPWVSDSYSPPRRPYTEPIGSAEAKNKYGDSWDNPKFL